MDLVHGQKLQKNTENSKFPRNGQKYLSFDQKNINSLKIALT